MNFLQNIFGKKELPINTFDDFWNWFAENERTFFQVVKNSGDMEKRFFDELSPKLGELNDGIFFLTGMLDSNTVELILTPDGAIEKMGFVEDLVESAPKIAGWKFTALKPPAGEGFYLQMAGYKFGVENISFFPNEFPEFPDEIDIVIVPEDLKETNEKEITHGTFIFLDNYLGELNFATQIDNLSFATREKCKSELHPVAELKSYLTRRQNEFIEKYQGFRLHTDTDEHALVEGQFADGGVFFAIVNTDALLWDSKASHPWILNIEIGFDGSQNNGMPDSNTFDLLNQIEDEAMLELTDAEGYLNIGRQTSVNLREIYFACHEFRKPADVLRVLKKNYSGELEIKYQIYKDKYWRSFKRFMDVPNGDDQMLN